jgi:hypothetical protein
MICCFSSFESGIDFLHLLRTAGPSGRRTTGRSLRIPASSEMAI